MLALPFSFFFFLFFDCFNPLLGAVPNHLQELQCTTEISPPLHVQRPFVVLWTSQATVRYNQFIPSTCRQSCWTYFFQEVGDLPRYRERAKSGEVKSRYFSPSYLDHKVVGYWSYTFFDISSFSHTVQSCITIKSECQRMEELGTVFVRRVTNISAMTCS